MTVDESTLKANIQAEKIRISMKNPTSPEPECDAVHKTEAHSVMKGVKIKKSTFWACAMQ